MTLSQKLDMFGLALDIIGFSIPLRASLTNCHEKRFCHLRSG